MKTGHTRQSRSQMARKRSAIESKRQQVGGLEALVEMWEGNGDGDYVRHLKHRLHAAQQNLKAMGA